MTSHTNFLQSLGWAVLNSLWQMALLWVACQCITSIFKKGKSSFKGALASGLLISGFAWFIYTFFSAYFRSVNTPAATFTFIASENIYSINNLLQKTLPAASVVYLILLIMPLMRFIRNYRYVKIIRKYGLTKINVEWRIFINNVAQRMGIKKPVSIWISELVSSPVTIGFLKPIILVPLAAINHLTPKQLEAILLHELSHIRRYDYLINLILNVIKTVLYFNPFVKVFVKIVEEEREKTCDNMVLQFQYNSWEYAYALLTLEKTNRLYKPLIIGATGNTNDLLNRVELIMGIKKKTVVSFNKLAGIFTSIFCIIGLNILLSLSKQKNTGLAVSSFSALSSFTFSDADKSNNNTPEVNINGAMDVVINEHLSQIENKVADLQPEKTADDENEPGPAILTAFANFELPAESPELKKYQEEQVKEALEASKKVLTSEQWKDIEKNIAEVFTQKEKEELKSTYQKEINKFDWKQWENKLRVAYDKIDWEKVNNQLSNAVNQVKMDSLQVVYNKALSKLDILQEELDANNITGIPDTDITLKEVEQRRKEAHRVLSNLKAIRSKKVVHL